MTPLRISVVTGGAGFIGSHLCKALLASGEAVRVLDDLSTGQEAWLPVSPPCDVERGSIAVANVRSACAVPGLLYHSSVESGRRCVEKKSVFRSCGEKPVPP
jgi:UDP-glucose 4-epimerase